MWTSQLATQIRNHATLPVADLVVPEQPRSKISASESDWSTIVDLDLLRPSPQLAENHFLARFINKSELLSARDLITILSDPRIDLDLSGFDCGTVPASTNPDSSYSFHSWTRDSAIAACALRRAGDLNKAELVVSNLARFYNDEELRARFIRYHFDPDAPESYQRGDTLPLIRSKIGQNGEMVRFRVNNNGHLEDAEGWGHQQLDALAEWLWITFRMANRSELDLCVLNQSLNEINPNNCLESIFSVALVFLERIECWNRGDLGMWEEPPSTRRASSLMMLTSALREAREFFQNRGWDALMHASEGSNLENKLRLEHAVTNTHAYLFETLKQYIPNAPGALAYECIDRDGKKRVDSAMLIGIYPFDSGLSQQQKINVVRSCYQLLGEVGFARYRGDEYVGQDYIHVTTPYHMSDSTVAQFREAGWLPPDATLAGYYFREFEHGGCRDHMLRKLGDAHLKRALCMITSQPSTFVIAESGEQIEISRGICPEAYFFDSQLGNWTPNHNSPLNWSKAAVALGIERGLIAAMLDD